jgi:hypothetical protein
MTPVRRRAGRGAAVIIGRLAPMRIRPVVNRAETASPHFRRLPQDGARW